MTVETAWLALVFPGRRPAPFGLPPVRRLGHFCKLSLPVQFGHSWPDVHEAFVVATEDTEEDEVTEMKGGEQDIRGSNLCGPPDGTNDPTRTVQVDDTSLEAAVRW